MIGKTRMAAVATAGVAVFILLLSFTALMSASATSPVAGHYEAELPGTYESLKQTFLTMFPEFEASNLHYKNPNLGPGGVLTLDVQYLKAKTNTPAESLHLMARRLKLEMSVPVIGPILKASGGYVEMDIDLHQPDPDTGEFGRLTATFRGNVSFNTPPPGTPSPVPYFSYKGPQLTVELTFIEPRYDVVVTPNELTIIVDSEGNPVGPPPTATVTVTSKTRFSNNIWLQWISDSGSEVVWGYCDPSASRPIPQGESWTTTLQVGLEWPTTGGTYSGRVVVHDTGSMPPADSWSENVSVVVQQQPP